MAKIEANESLRSEGQECCTQKTYELTEADLPLSCPLQDMRVWDGHPRIYLPITDLGKVVCPYCGTKYVLKDFISTRRE